MESFGTNGAPRDRFVKNKQSFRKGATLKDAVTPCTNWTVEPHFLGGNHQSRVRHHDGYVLGVSVGTNLLPIR